MIDREDPQSHSLMPSSITRPSYKTVPRFSFHYNLFHSGFIVAAFLVAGFFAAFNISSWYTRITYPGEESYEGVPLVEMVQLREGIPIYNPPSAKGFAEATYGPLYYLLGSRLINPTHPSYLPLRLLSAFAMLACAAGCGLLAYWITKSHAAAFLSPLVFLSYGIVTAHGIKALSDAVALLLFFSGFLVAYRFRNSKAILLAAPLMILGFFYKPQYIAGPVAVLLFLVLEKLYHRAAQFAGLLAGAGLALLAFFQWVVFAGQAFLQHFLLYQSSLLWWERFEHGVLMFAVILAGPILLSVAFLRDQPNRLIACYLVSAAVFGLITYGKIGSGFHYFFETVLLTSVLVPALIISQSRARTLSVDLIVLLGAFLLLGQYHTQRAPGSDDFIRFEKLESYLKHNFTPGAPGLALAPGDLAQAGLSTPFVDPFTLSGLAHLGKLSDDSLVSQIRGRGFAVIVLIFNIETEKDPARLNSYLTEPMRQAITSGYKLKAIFDIPSIVQEHPQDRFYVYVPIGSSKSPL